MSKQSTSFGLCGFAAGIAILVACSSAEADSAPGEAGGTSGSGGSEGGDGEGSGGRAGRPATGGSTSAGGGEAGDGSGNATSTGGKGGSGRAGSGAGGGGNTTSTGGKGGTSSGKGTPGGPTPCGDGFAFCDTFDAPTDSPGPRTVDLDHGSWSVGRIAPQLASFGECTICAGPATIPTCRSGVGTTVFPDQDTLICDPTEGVGSSHLLTAVASQNYGLNSYRIRQPFDFKDRTGKIVFDLEAHAPEALWGWASLEVSADPTPTPSYPNFEYGPLPRSEVSFQIAACEGSTKAGVREGRVFRDYAMTMLQPSEEVSGDSCLETADDRMNRFEVHLSRTSIEVFASDMSDDGLNFPELRRMYAAELDLDFDRGWVTITARNHATAKYSENTVDAWVVRWDNVGFDGDVFTNWREYSVPDSLTDTSDGTRNVGYRVPGNDSEALSVELEDVNPSGAVRALLAFTTYYPLCCESSDYTTYNLRYRVNGGAWQDRFLTPGEVAALSLDDQQGGHNQTIELDPEELQEGRNTFEFYTSGVNQGYDVAIANIDLVLTTN